MFLLYNYCLWKIGLKQMDMCPWLWMSTSSHLLCLQTFIEKFPKGSSRLRLLVTISSIPPPSQLIPGRPWSTQRQENQLLSRAPVASMRLNPVIHSGSWASASPSTLGGVTGHLYTNWHSGSSCHCGIISLLGGEVLLHLTAFSQSCSVSPSRLLNLSLLEGPSRIRSSSLFASLAANSCICLNVFCILMTPKQLPRTWISPLDSRLLH